MKISHIIPILIAFLTGYRREIIRQGKDFEWSQMSWTHCVFRVYESICGRRHGVRHESTLIFDSDGNEWYFAHTWEASVARFEAQVRATVRDALVFKWQPFKIYIPVLYTPEGFPVPASPYLFAITRPSSNNSDSQSQTTDPYTFAGSQTVSGSNNYLVCGVNVAPHTQSITSVKFNTSEAMTAQQTYDFETTNVNKYAQILTLANPTATTSAIVVDLSGAPGAWSKGISMQYSGVNQSTDFTTVHNSSKTTGAATTTQTGNVTVRVTNSIICGFNDSQGASQTASTGTQLILNPPDNFFEPAAFENTSLTGLATGAQSLVTTTASAVDFYWLMVALAPPSVVPPPNPGVSDYIIYN